MTPGTLCIIEPTSGALPCEREQLGGLIVTTLGLKFGGCWDVAPTPMVDYPTGVRFANGKFEPGRHLVAVHESWLRPLRGERQQTDTRTDRSVPA